MKTNKLFKLPTHRAAAPTAVWLRFAALGLALLMPASLHAVSVKFTSSGTFTPPAGITSVTVECWGGGGAGGSAYKGASPAGNAGGGGGGAGAYAKKLSVPVTPGVPYTVTISPEAPGLTTFVDGQTSDGAPVTFTGDGGVIVTANGGQGGACVITTNGAAQGLGGAGGAVSGLYDVEWAGGGGWRNTGSGNSGSGGSAASDTKAGVTATSQSTGANLTATTGSDTDHNGGRGDTGKSAEGNGNGLATQPGGGGGGAKDNTSDAVTRVGANGRKGQIIISYSGATVVKANNTTNLNLGTSWVGGSAPGTTDNAKWDNTVTNANTTSLGTNLAWGSIVIADPAGLVTINAGNTVTNNGGIDMSAATADLTLNCGYVLGNGAVWNLAAGRTLTLSGAISGATGNNITMLGDGTNVLSGANTYAGNTVLIAGSTGGTLKLGASNVIPDGAGKGDVTIGFGCTLDLNGQSETINGLNGTSSGSLISLIDNTAAGTTSTLTVGVTQAVASTVFSGILQNTGAGSTLNFVKTGTGKLTLQKANTLTGTVTVSGGTLAVQNATPFDNISGLSIGGSTFACVNSATLPAAPVTLTGNATFNVGDSGSGTLTLNGPIGGAGNILIQCAPNTVGDGPLLILGAPNTFTGNVTIDSNPSSTVNSMTVRLGVANALPTNTVVTLDGQNSSGVHYCDLDLNGNDQTLAGLTNVARSGRLQRVYSAVGPATLTISNSASYAFGGMLGNFDAGGDNLALVKSGASTFTLSRAAGSTYANGTFINGGTLLVNNTTGSGTGSGTVVVNSGGTLGGSGTIDGAVTNLAGGTLSPGTSIGTLTLNGDLILEAGSTNTFEVDGTTPTNDAVVLNVGAVTYGGVLKIVPSGSFVNGQTFTLFSGAGATNASQFSSIAVNPPVSGTSFMFTNGVLMAVVTGPSGPAALTNSFSSGVLSLSWPAGQGWRLQSQTNSLSTGITTNWVYVTDGSLSSTNITVDATKPTVFYRLKYP